MEVRKELLDNLPGEATDIRLKEVSAILQDSITYWIAERGIPLIDEMLDRSYLMGLEKAAWMAQRFNIPVPVHNAEAMAISWPNITVTGILGKGGPFDEKTLDLLKDRNLSLLTGMTDTVTKDIQEQISQGMLAGEGMDEISRRIGNVAGFEETYSNRAYTIARTETAMATETAAFGQYAQLGIGKVQFIAALDDRTCDECAPLDMQVFDLADAPVIPIHPNCRCDFIPVPDEGPEFKPFTEEEIEAYRKDSSTPRFRLPTEKVIVPPTPAPVVATETATAIAVEKTIEQVLPTISAPEFDIDKLINWDTSAKNAAKIEEEIIKKIFRVPYKRDINMSAEMKEGLEHYQGYGYSNINKWLRGDKITVYSEQGYTKKELHSMALKKVKYNEKLMASAFRRNGQGAGEGVELFRGIGETSGKYYLDLPIGKAFPDKAYQSFSYKGVTANGFSKQWITKENNNEVTNRVVVRLITDGKEKFIWMSHRDTEAELLLNKNTWMRVVAKEVRDENAYWQGENKIMRTHLITITRTNAPPK